MHIDLPGLHVALPGWVKTFLDSYPPAIPDIKERMRMVIALSMENVQNSTGGPFGAAVFDEAGKMIAPGINMVTAKNNCVLHAEIVAIMLAQKKSGFYDLSMGGTRQLELFTTTEPCAMCLGAVCWSGITRLVCGAKSKDAREIGFDEGPRPVQWGSELRARKIDVIKGVCRNEAAGVLRRYREAGGVIYNARLNVR